MLKKIFTTHGRHKCEQLTAALLAVTPSVLVNELVRMFSAGEIRFVSKRRRSGARSICSKFYAYHKANPHVADWFLQAAQALQEKENRTRYSISALTEKIRYDIQMGIIKTDGFRISNDVRACYARLVLMRDPRLIGLFSLKTSSVGHSLVVDGCSWSEFAKQHHAEIWPERLAKASSERKAQGTVPLEGSAEKKTS